ncbi:hypothetical protein PAXRUDRAFT_178966 [Paxillus rubicundulus Ve08.2h10]|uniref:Uncharacterized protein n=1 Tax=Paxillus rubicundulus Ve08.2h10 TaxID=930991 RepID=A0A0D0D084_9AGAM|nr:hypothetical protein PAXRUDRAFT_178966 [Paxillus rubicundulus Ve08.2h10]
MPTGPEAQCILKEARPICKHLITDMWDKLGPQIPEYLDSVKVKWSTIDVTCFTKVEKDAGPVFIWVGVKPRSLSCPYIVEPPTIYWWACTYLTQSP